MGRWVAAGKERTDAFLAFAADGTYTGCNGSRGRYALGKHGRLLATVGPTTLIGCDGAPRPRLDASGRPRRPGWRAARTAQRAGPRPGAPSPLTDAAYRGWLAHAHAQRTEQAVTER